MKESQKCRPTHRELHPGFLVAALVVFVLRACTAVPFAHALSARSYHEHAHSLVPAGVAGHVGEGCGESSEGPIAGPDPHTPWSDKTGPSAGHSMYACVDRLDASAAHARSSSSLVKGERELSNHILGSWITFSAFLHSPITFMGAVKSDPSV